MLQANFHSVKNKMTHHTHDIGFTDVLGEAGGNKGIMRKTFGKKLYGVKSY